MQIGIDVGATKIESVVLEKDGQEKHRSRIACPKDYLQIVNAIKDIHQQLEKKFHIQESFIHLMILFLRSHFQKIQLNLQFLVH